MKRISALIKTFCLLFITINASRITSNYTQSSEYEGAQLLQVANTDPDTIKHLVDKHFLDLWGHNKSHAEIMIPRSMVNMVKQYLRKNRVPFRIMMADVQQVIDEEKELSYKNNYLFDEGIHAREWISPAAVLYVIREMIEKRDKLPKDLLELDFYIVPVLNPDGYEYTHTKKRLWRKNRSQRGPGCQGIDLNRNFDIYWAGKGTSKHHCSQVYVGPAPFSEPESLAIADFLMNIRNLKAYISVHSYSQLLLLPYAYDAVKPSDYEELKETADRAAESMLLAGGEYYQVGTSPDILYPASGSSADWAKAVAGVKYSYTFELRDTGKHGFLLPASQIVPTGKELFQAVKVIASAAARS